MECMPKPDLMVAGVVAGALIGGLLVLWRRRGELSGLSGPGCPGRHHHHDRNGRPFWGDYCCQDARNGSGSTACPKGR